MEVEKQSVTIAIENLEKIGDSNPKSDDKVVSDSTNDFENETIILEVLSSESIDSSPILEKESNAKDDVISVVFASISSKELNKNHSNGGNIV